MITIPGLLFACHHGQPLYILAGGMAGIATVLLVFYTNSVSPSSFGSFYELYAIADQQLARRPAARAAK